MEVQITMKQDYTTKSTDVITVCQSVEKHPEVPKKRNNMRTMMVGQSVQRHPVLPELSISVHGCTHSLSKSSYVSEI
jgi:hypothetical protein